MKTRAQGKGASTAEVPIYHTEENRAGLISLYQEKLRQWPVPFETFFVPTRYGKTHVIASGDPASPPVILLHPEATSALAWSPMFPALIERYRIYAPDTIGDVGRSELDDFDVYPRKGRDFSAWLDDVYRELGIAQADLIGGSMGGWVAMHRAINASDSVRKLVLLGPMGLPSRRSTLRLLGPMMSLALRPTDAKRDEMVRRGFGDGERVNREMGPWMKIAGKCRGRVGWPFKIPDAALRTIKAPTLLFLGGQDGAVGSATAAANRARRTIARCQIEILPKAGHLMIFDEPEFIGGRIAGFLGGA
ncbi:MAG TPA: alpha/beta hydrolase [Actinomycetes bacterium]|jgi:pimeloyl-ACP methyl ester carboxylesterase|nr:alpha/beta hydrolase [Actinomycetes bacterium]